MNEASKWRLAVAQKVAPIIARNPHVQAIMLGGSSSRGWADSYSDIEIGAFWAKPPTDEERMAPIVPAGGIFWELDDYDEEDDIWMEEWGLGGVKMDMRNLTVDRVERIITDVVEQYDTSAFKQATANAVFYGIPLYNALLLERWKAKLADYPEGLRVAMVQANLLYHDWDWVEMLVQREDMVHSYSDFIEAIECMVGMLMGLNRIYHSGTKWLDKLAKGMLIVPHNFASRVNAIFHAQPHEAARMVRTLVLEVYDLVEKHLPGTDVQQVRTSFLRKREKFENAPEGVIE